jgi:glycosyltransferase involved in cell wall biosynthesis
MVCPRGKGDPCGAWGAASFDLMRLLYYCPGSIGGIGDYTYSQAAALSAMGVDVTLLVSRECEPPSPNYAVERVLRNESRRFSGPRLLRQIKRSALICGNILRLRRAILKGGFQHVMLASYVEYAAPLWSFELTGLVRRGVRFGAVLHDPIRNSVAGPEWWHRWSIRCGYAFLMDVFVHERIDRTEAGTPGEVRITVVPHGPFDFPPPTQSREEMRTRLGVPAEARLMLSFGHIRDGKNLDFVLRAMVQAPELWLLVAGAEAGGVHRPLQYYQDLAKELGIAERCRWLPGHLAKRDVGSVFEASDVAIMAYSHTFRSASGVLNTAVRFRKPCIASSGPGNLKTQIQKFSLGVWVEPDSVEALVLGFRQWLQAASQPHWQEYEKENSWQRNAELVADQFLRQP